MKKIITILSIALAATLLSSCIIVHPDEETVFERSKISKESGADENTKTHTITVKNETDTKVSKWWVKSKDTMILPNNTLDRSIAAHKEDQISDLPEGYYVVYFIYSDGYETYETINLNKDIVYCLSNGPVQNSYSCKIAK